MDHEKYFFEGAFEFRAHFERNLPSNQFPPDQVRNTCDIIWHAFWYIAIMYDRNASPANLQSWALRLAEEGIDDWDEDMYARAVSLAPKERQPTNFWNSGEICNELTQKIHNKIRCQFG
ncbi:hypothetical protein A2881_02030 [Candidatus Peribacteria bacterium RIFCSPHIGHO2_01_FULL_55_13]|nr:MAG: hypothetical protein A2881_02030 [Candidatus Peribacteria bacterium RIFCSPHIGHO2_01_FULL_55_13]OGJ65335.1 MAG: hypothetical protein A3F36_02185 [Candidatus Peribacteria bacterium RIFCSPHIGHO2_12_FULL_55_11]